MDPRWILEFHSHAWPPGLIFIPPCSLGMMLGGGCGRELAHWIIHGRPEKDMYGYDIRQVTPSVPAASTGIPPPCCSLGMLPRQGWHQQWVSRQSLCLSEELESITRSLMNAHVGFISFASLHSHTNNFHQAQGDLCNGEGRGNYVWALLFN